MKTIHPGHLEHRFCIFGCQILCITDLAIMPHIVLTDTQSEKIQLYLFIPLNLIIGCRVKEDVHCLQWGVVQ